MLTDLTIRNIAIIETVQISLNEGLTVLTGETGAGKSIIIDAIGLVMGGRASMDLIRSGEEEAVVEAAFDISAHPAIAALLDASGFDHDSELLVKRSISRSGKNRIFINGGMATLALLSDLTPRLINIYGQHESQTLLKPENHVRLLDSFAGLTPLCERFSILHEQLRTLRSRLDRLEDEQRDAERKLDLLSYQSEEIARAEFRSGEEEELEQRRHILAAAEKLGSGTHDAFERLYGDDGPLLGSLRRIAASISGLAAIDATLLPVAETLGSSYLQLEDAAITLRDYASRIESDPLALQQIDDRLDLIGRLKKKYGATIEAVLLCKKQVDDELAAIREQQYDRQGLEEQHERMSAELNICGSELTEKRAAAAIKLKKALECEIHQLAMKNAIIDIGFEKLSEPRSTGFERVELLFSPNPGEPPRPLARIASGGELSRMMLAFKQVLPERDVPTLIFDEVDTGISGATSELVGSKLKKVASGQQVLCITHLPQVAAFADHHLCVEKQVIGARTSTRLTMLDKKERISEIARMLAGTNITESAMKHAAELIAATGERFVYVQEHGRSSKSGIRSSD